MIRLFAALALPPEIVGGLVRRQSGVENARWRSPESLHITLRFFGEVRQDVARDLDAELATIDVPPFEIVLEGAGSFGDGRDIHAIWAGVEESPMLRRLADACETAARRAGLKPEKRNYKPHVTLAYLKQADPAEVAGWIQGHNLLKSPPIEVDRFGLYSSTLGGEGAHYRLEAEYPLG
jgi:2'-5' RNA ligase